MKSMERGIQVAGRLVCACLLVGASFWIAGAAADVPQAALAGQYLVLPFLVLCATYVVVAGTGMAISIPAMLARAAWRWWRSE
jgi:hypothetical protein